MAAMAARNGHHKTPTALHDTSLTPALPFQSPPMPVSRTPAPPTMLPAVAAQHGPPPPAPISHLISPILTSKPTPLTPAPRHNHKSTPDTGFRTFNTSTPRTHTSFSSLLHDIHQFNSEPEDSNDIISTSFDEYEVEDYLSGTSLHAKHLPMSTSVQGVEELRKEVCLLKTQVELLHDELRQLKKRIKVSQSFYQCVFIILFCF